MIEVREFFERALDNVCVAGFDGYFKHLSASWSKTLGRTREELMSKPSLEFVHPDDRAVTLEGRARLVAGGELGPFVNRYSCKDGRFRWFEWRSVADVDRQLVYCVARDVTEQKMAEEQVRAAAVRQKELQSQLVFADRMASIGTLAAGVAHEINNPLAFVVASLDLIEERLQRADATTTSLATDLRKLLSEAAVGAERIRRTVGALKTFSRGEAEQRCVLDVPKLLELSLKMTAGELRHRARLVTAYGPTPPVEADEARLGQVFINLLINAGQAIPDDGNPAHEIRVETWTDAEGRAVIEVRDTGLGVPEPLLSRVFDPFFTTKPVGIGTGLGLSVSHAIVSSLGGSLSVSNAPTGGAIFRVVLPGARSSEIVGETRAASPAPPPPVETTRGLMVLVVDDEPAIGGLLRRILLGHRVSAVTGARQALELLESGKSFDVIVSDVMMPEMSGLDLYAELQRRFPPYPARVVFLSGGAVTPATKSFLEQVDNPRIDKPFDAAQVRQVVQEVAARARR